MIPWAALRLLASGGLEAVLKGLSKAAEWLVSDWRNLPLVIFGALALWQGWVTIPARDSTIAETAQVLTDTQLAHIGTIANFMDATEQAEREAEANAARVKTEQETITDATLADLRADRDDVRARFDRLRIRDAARTDLRRADPADLPGLPDAPGRAAASAPDHNLRAARGATARELTAQPACPPGLVCMTIDEAQAASQDARAHNRLIDWVIAQSAVRFTPEEPRR